MRTTLEVKDLSAGYQTPVVQNVSFEIKEGQLAAILGPNGAGKSTLLNAMAGGVRKTTGQVLVNGQDCLPLSPKQRARRLALVRQQIPLLPGVRVEEALEMGRYAWGGPLRADPGAKAAVAEAARAFELEELLNADCAALSQGQRQLVHLARAVVQSAPVLLLDEPGSALDFSNTHRLFRLLGEQLAAGGRCAAAVLHDPALALRYCSPVLLLKEGRILERLEPSACTAPQIERALGLLYPGIRVKADKETGHFLCTTE
ncbi:ABC transporter ATP-binding protein [Candidatus Allofournierella merdipullorum]|uniref:ABC transporter ATP-binding protein n=1 Tax=Candidatus Allofournierella merdipullorum TaxID=2838595 RepID=UPI002A8DB4D5|nr:ABC transporter ATP-binding protein [Candidatus Fournierella merdipullorum]